MDFLKKEQNLTVADNSDCNKATTELGRTVCNAAEQGDAKQQFSLGEMYYHGEGIAQDFSKVASVPRLLKKTLLMLSSN